MKVIGIVIVLSALVLCLGLVGCPKPTTGDDYKALAAKVDTLMATVQIAQAGSMALVESLHSQNIINDEQYEQAKKVAEEMARVTPQIKDMTAAMKAGTYTSGDGSQLANIITALEAAKAANAATSGWNQYSEIIGMVLAAIIAILGVFAKQGAATATKYAAYKAGVEKAKLQLDKMADKDITSPVVASMIYNSVGEERKAKGIV
jgi:hypothetical protein